METTFSYEKIDLNNDKHIRCLKQLWNDETNKKYFLIFSMQSTFEWFLSELNRPYSTLFDRLIKCNNEYIGWVKCLTYEIDNVKGASLDYSIIKEYRGMGLGKKFLCDFINNLDADEVIVEIHEDNKVGIALVESLGFKKYGEDKESATLKYKLEVSRIRNKHSK